MGFLSSVADAYLRWRHSHGFGVHSPFAYRFVKEAVRPARGYSFYGYSDIDDALTHCKTTAYRRLRNDARFLLRASAFLRVKRMLAEPSVHEVFTVAARGAGVETSVWRSRHPADPQPGDLLLVGHSWHAPGEITRRLAAGNPVIAFDPPADARAEIMAFHAPGMLLHGRRTLLAVPNPDMAFTSYAMSF